jgi:hypothetical protein
VRCRRNPAAQTSFPLKVFRAGSENNINRFNESAVR